MKDLRTRHNPDLEIDLEGPAGWSRGSAWDTDSSLHQGTIRIDQASTSTRGR